MCEREAASGTVPSECEAEGLYQNGFLSGERPLTSTFGGGAEGTEAEGVALVGLLLPSRQAVPPPPKVEVKGRSPDVWWVIFPCRSQSGDEDEKPNNRTSAIQSPLAGRRLLKLPVGQRSLGAGCLFALVRGVGC